ncbi:hypothetical protein EMCG_07639 [[Emmonsia] crescens]|uniref:Uncharacterized protein n=1 Tax=[Emmonsia] crescens TaxID=73230 RepID=A0A0G2I7S4_9EURO|nr:hypothetical protein EMCG_07639 [Emmonsia crescens UAMH 3008]
MPKRLTQEQKHAVTAALFRQEPYLDIATTYGVSERRLRRIASCLRKWGTTHPPRTKPMGRPKTITDEIQESLRDFVNARPLANLEDMQSHIQSTFIIKCSYQAVSRRLRDMGYIRTIVQRGSRSLEKNNLPLLSNADKLRLQSDPTAAEHLDKPKVTYAWLLKTPKPSAKRSKPATENKPSAAQKGNDNANTGRPPEERADDEQDEEESLDDLFDGDDSVSGLTPNASPSLTN